MMTNTQAVPAPIASSLWWRGSVLYQIYPRSFFDTNADGVGDLRGVIEKLDHVAALGVDGIWLSPFFRSPMNDFGYDVSDYFDVDPIFGTLEDFDRLVAKAHALDLKVVIDQVYSHTSHQHGWFAESRQSRTNPKADWYVWADPKPDGSPPNNWLSVFGGVAWTWDGRRRQYYLHNFLSSQPDLNVHNPEVQDALLNVARFWLDRGVDGFRLDAINFAMHDPQLRDNPPSDRNDTAGRVFDMQDHIHNQSQAEVTQFLERLRGVMDEQPGRFTLAEVGGANALAEMQAYTRGDQRLNSAYSFAYLNAPEVNAPFVRSVTLEWSEDPQEGWPSWAFSNHDAPRCLSRWYDGDKPENYAKLTALLLLTLRGNAILYQGEELGLPQAEVPYDKLQDPEAITNWPETLGRDGARTPMPWHAHQVHAGFTQADVEPWLPVDRRHEPLAADVQADDSNSVLSFYKEIIGLRKQSPALRQGSITFADAPVGVIAFERRLHDERLMVLINHSSARIPWVAGASGSVLLTTRRGVLTDVERTPNPPVMEPYTGYVIII